MSMLDRTSYFFEWLNWLDELCLLGQCGRAFGLDIGRVSDWYAEVRRRRVCYVEILPSLTSQQFFRAVLKEVDRDGSIAKGEDPRLLAVSKLKAFAIGVLVVRLVCRGRI